MNNLSILRNTLRVFGIAFILIIPMMKLDPLGGWAWSPGQWEYEMMIQGVYMTLGVMMIIASKEPVKHYMFVWFVVWSSIVHGGIMAYQAIIDEHEMGHFLGDIPALFILAILLVLPPLKTLPIPQKTKGIIIIPIKIPANLVFEKFLNVFNILF